uniref:Secreted protein n=1 Tax=Anguilla anguilla TaxID=7936 RepID=A0A0E9UDK7_ANGAN
MFPVSLFSINFCRLLLCRTFEQTRLLSAAVPPFLAGCKLLPSFNTAPLIFTPVFHVTILEEPFQVICFFSA